MEKVFINPKVESSWPFKKILFLKLFFEKGVGFIVLSSLFSFQIDPCLSASFISQLIYFCS